jgi:hypothetical protein
MGFCGASGVGCLRLSLEFQGVTSKIPPKMKDHSQFASTCQLISYVQYILSYHKFPTAILLGFTRKTGTVLEPYWALPGPLLEPCWNRAGTVLEPCWSLPGTVLEPSWNLCGTFRNLVGTVLDCWICRNFVGTFLEPSFLELCWNLTGSMLELLCFHFGYSA